MVWPPSTRSVLYKDDLSSFLTIQCLDFHLESSTPFNIKDLCRCCDTEMSDRGEMFFGNREGIDSVSWHRGGTHDPSGEHCRRCSSRVPSTVTHWDSVPVPVRHVSESLGSAV